MKVEYLNAFVQAAYEIFQELTGVVLKKEKVHLSAYPIPSYEISIIVGITGFITGQVVYSLTPPMAETLVTKWLKKIPENKKEMLIKSGITEIANMITGRSTSLLQKKNNILSVTPPSIITGDKFKIEFIKLKTIVVTMSSDIGTIEISLALKDEGIEDDAE